MKEMGWGLLALDGLRRELSRTERIKVRVNLFGREIPLTFVSPARGERFLFFFYPV